MSALPGTHPAALPKPNAKLVLRCTAFSDPTVLALGPEAILLALIVETKAARRDTYDVPAHVLAEQPLVADPAAAVQKLVSAGRWMPTPDGFRIVTPLAGRRSS